MEPPRPHWQVLFINNVFYFVMEYASGGSLVGFIRSHEGHRLPEHVACRVFRQITAALDFCHRRRVIHRCVATPPPPPHNCCAAAVLLRREPALRARHSPDRP